MGSRWADLALDPTSGQGFGLLGLWSGFAAGQVSNSDPQAEALVRGNALIRCLTELFTNSSDVVDQPRIVDLAVQG